MNTAPIGIPAEKVHSPWVALANTSVLWPSVAILGIGSFLNYRPGDLLDLFSFILVVLSSLLPSYLWCSRQVHGIPLFPLQALCNIWAFALPLISGHPIVMLYPVLDRFAAALTVVVSTLVGTVVWYILTHRQSRARAQCLALEAKRCEWLFLSALVLSVLFNVFSNSIYQASPEFFSLVKQIIIALGNLAIFVLSYRFGTRELKANYRWIFGFLFSLLVLTSLPSLYLITTVSYIVLALLGFVLGRGKIPWLILSLILVVFSFLHLGKAEMRDKYWAENNAQTVGLMDYPGFLADWADKSLSNICNVKGAAFQGPVVEDHQSFVTRSSLMHLLLLEQSLTPASLPYLQGYSYTMIPQFLVPRFLNPQKGSVTNGTNFLAIYYGLIDPNQPINTVIGFGMLNEAYANFGYTGCVALGLFLGLFYGGVAKFSSAYPLLSLRSLFAVLVLAVAFQDEFTSCVFVSTLFQSGIVLCSAGFLFMKRVAIPSSEIR